MSERRISDIEETEDAMLQRSQLRRVHAYLLATGVPEDLVEAVEIAIEDIERYIDPVLETAIGAASQRASPAT